MFNRVLRANTAQRNHHVMMGLGSDIYGLMCKMNRYALCWHLMDFHPISVSINSWLTWMSCELIECWCTIICSISTSIFIMTSHVNGCLVFTSWISTWTCEFCESFVQRSAFLDLDTIYSINPIFQANQQSGHSWHSCPQKYNVWCYCVCIFPCLSQIPPCLRRTLKVKIVCTFIDPRVIVWMVRCGCCERWIVKRCIEWDPGHREGHHLTGHVPSEMP